MITSYHKEFLSQPLALWMGSASAENIPDTVRCLGIVVEDENILKCFIAERFSEEFIRNLSQNKNINIAGSHMFSFKGYQYKGEMIDIRPSSHEEVEIQKQYMDVFSTDMAKFGLEKQRLYDMYFHLPSVAIRMKVNKIYEQAPEANTGGEVQ